MYSLCSVSAESLLSAPRSIFTLWDHRGVGWFRSYLGTRILDKFLVVGLFQTPRLPENIWSPVVACLAVVSCPLRLLLPVSRFVLASKRSFSVAEVTRNPFNLLHRMPRADAPFREEPFAANLPFLLSLSLNFHFDTHCSMYNYYFCSSGILKQRHRGLPIWPKTSRRIRRMLPTLLSRESFDSLDNFGEALEALKRQILLLEYLICAKSLHLRACFVYVA